MHPPLTVISCRLGYGFSYRAVTRTVTVAAYTAQETFSPALDAHTP